ncbi:MAG: 4-hydroxybenzoyl-CoA reductase subunit gamma [Proteobacteria bacterium]|nr:MAG: 4-hydroxybenzoyl-CoA reductase subunit gamma [Pseudomonadota bacterium]
MSAKHKISVTLNGKKIEREVEPRLLLGDFLREEIGLLGVHHGCEQGVCGACTILLNGDSVRACLMFAVQADGAEITTVEGIGEPGNLHPLQQSFWDHHALQCGFCTPGMLLTSIDLIKKYPLENDEQIRHGLSGNICRCTGYQNIVTAVREAAPGLRAAK